MSRCLDIVLENTGFCALPAEMDLKGEALMFGGNLPAASLLLEDIAEDLNITPLSAFMLEENDGGEALETSPEWYDPNQGLDTVQKLLNYLLAYPEVDKSPEGVHWVLWDLRALELILRDAVQTNDRFYLEEG